MANTKILNLELKISMKESFRYITIVITDQSMTSNNLVLLITVEFYEQFNSVFYHIPYNVKLY